ncbi:LPXTG cell wall anchor domain-containing protein [Streptomyces microflavus]|uniref:LPXTG cell wall anchor domain-containing protein n=1 Tax=Streptomyces TaxID=1883 RepID=UPI001C597F21|nr:MULTISPECIES: LPXTG cell wall anchor domain-containing protein [unclassified Streptomyces]MBW3359078.1 LPXTG cell wall anchor domain-containing protein [Streptomyces sp. 09ZI22]MEE1730758.1 LPXTG cell wall anchor domain-containing protein [Streptomyces sp. BE282]
MKIRRVLATAVAIAVTTPAAMLSVTPAFADTEPAAQPQAKPTVKELEKAAAEAQKAYDEAVAAEKVARKVVDEALSDSAPLAVAAKAARKAAEDAATAKTTADQAVTDAKAALDALPAEPTPEEKAAAEKTLAEAETAATAAATAKTTADAEARTAVDLADDARVAAVRVYGKAQAAVEETLAAKTAADAALARAKEEENQGGGECLDEPGLTTVVTGFPSKVTAGTATTFSVRVTNGTDKDMEKVLTYASVHATDKSGAKDIAKYLKLKWSSVSSPKWKTVDGDLYIDTIGALKRGEHGDIKLRLDVDAKAPAGQGLTFIAGDYFNKDGCGLTPDAAVNKFDIKAAAGKPTPKPDPKPTKSAAAGSGVTPQGSGSSVPVNTTNGSLAATGSSDATVQIALAGGAAVVLGAGAMFLVRRRRTGADV